MLRQLFIVVILSVLTQAVTRTQCRHDTECGTGECCYYHEGPIIVSKRDILPVVMHQGGWCEKYLVLGDHCSPFARLNGHCSCGSNLKCKRFPYTTPSPSIVKRKLLPGYYRCDTV